MQWNERIESLMTGYRNGALMMSACRTGIFDALGDQWRTPAEVAETCALAHRPVDVVLHALAAAGLLRADADRFALDPEASPFLLSDSPATVASIIGHNYTMMRSWAQLETVLRTDQPAPRPEQTEQEMRDFICGMENVSRRSSAEVLKKFDFSGVRRLLDVGGGPGTAAITFAQAFPGLTCVVFDLPEPLKIAREQIEKAGLADRVTTLAGDLYTDSLGTDFDLAYVSNIIHMMGPEETLALFRSCARALAPGGRLLVKDFFLSDDRLQPASAAQFSVNMLVATEQGKSYTLSETLAMLEAAGYQDLASTDLAKASGVISAHWPG